MSLNPKAKLKPGNCIIHSGVFLRKSQLSRLCPALFCLMLSALTFALQQVCNNLQHFTTDDGLRHSFISSITKDRVGFYMDKHFGWISAL